MPRSTGPWPPYLIQDVYTVLQCRHDTDNSSDAAVSYPFQVLADRYTQEQIEEAMQAFDDANLLDWGVSLRTGWLAHYEPGFLDRLNAFLAAPPTCAPPPRQYPAAMINQALDVFGIRHGVVTPPQAYQWLVDRWGLDACVDLVGDLQDAELFGQVLRNGDVVDIDDRDPGFEQRLSRFKIEHAPPGGVHAFGGRP